MGYVGRGNSGSINCRKPPGIIAILALLVGVLGSYAPLPARAETIVCADPLLSVEAQSPDLSRHICEVAVEAKTLLSECHLEQTSPIRLTVVKMLSYDSVACLATFSCKESKIEILDHLSLQSALKKGNPFSLLPVEDLFDSLIVHEMTHALSLGVACGSEELFVDREYMAYAMQLASMSPTTRQSLLNEYSQSGTIEREEINDFVLLTAPAIFAAKAWRYFSESDNGCDLFRKIIDGDEFFYLEPY